MQSKKERGFFGGKAFYTTEFCVKIEEMNGYKELKRCITLIK